MAFVPVDCLSIPVSSFDSFLLKREFSGEFLCLGVCAPPALEYIYMTYHMLGSEIPRVELSDHPGPQPPPEISHRDCVGVP